MSMKQSELMLVPAPAESTTFFDPRSKYPQGGPDAFIRVHVKNLTQGESV